MNCVHIPHCSMNSILTDYLDMRKLPARRVLCLLKIDIRKEKVWKLQRGVWGCPTTILISFSQFHIQGWGFHAAQQTGNQGAAETGRKSAEEGYDGFVSQLIRQDSTRIWLKTTVSGQSKVLPTKTMQGAHLRSSGSGSNEESNAQTN